MKAWFRQPLWLQISVCIIIGIVLGILFGPGVAVLKPIGDMFIRLLKMLIVPLTVLTLISGIVKMKDQ